MANLHHQLRPHENATYVNAKNSRARRKQRAYARPIRNRKAANLRRAANISDQKAGHKPISIKLVPNQR